MGSGGWKGGFHNPDPLRAQVWGTSKANCFSKGVHQCHFLLCAFSMLVTKSSSLDAPLSSKSFPLDAPLFNWNQRSVFCCCTWLTLCRLFPSIRPRRSLPSGRSSSPASGRSAARGDPNKIAQFVQSKCIREKSSSSVSGLHCVIPRGCVHSLPER